MTLAPICGACLMSITAGYLAAAATSPNVDHAALKILGPRADVGAAVRPGPQAVAESTPEWPDLQVLVRTR